MKRPRSEKSTTPIYYVRRRRARRAPTSVHDILQRVLKKRNLDHKLAQYEFVLRWKEIVGVEIASRTFPEAVRRNELYVRVESPMWAQELTFQKGVLLKRLQRLTQFESLRDIRFVVGKLPTSSVSS